MATHNRNNDGLGLTRFERVKLTLSLSGYSRLDFNTFQKKSGRSDLKICRIMGKTLNLEIRIIDWQGKLKSLKTFPSETILRNF